MPTLLDDKVKQLGERIKSVGAEAKDKWTAFDNLRTELAKSDEDVSNTESDAFKKAEAAHRQYAEKSDELAVLEGQRERLWAMTAESNGKPKSEGERAVKEVREQVKDRAHSIPMGERIVASEGYKKLRESGMLDSTAKLDSVRLGKATDRAEFKALITGVSDTSGGAFVTNDEGGFFPRPNRPLFLTQLVMVGDTDSDAVEYVREGTFTNAAAETAEATATAGTSGTKPESTIVYEKAVEAVRTIAHWVPATRRALADAGQLRSLIDGRLREGLNQRLEGQMVSGDGLGENIRGILNTPGIGTVAAGTDPAVEGLHRAITVIRLAFHEPTAIGLHPNDWQGIRLAKNANGDYLYGPPALAGAQQVWGLPVVSGAQFPENTGLVGKYTAAELWVREGVQVLASDSHADFFIRNLIALLAEMRVAFGVTQPPAFCSVTGV